MITLNITLLSRRSKKKKTKKKKKKKKKKSEKKNNKKKNINYRHLPPDLALWFTLTTWKSQQRNEAQLKKFSCLSWESNPVLPVKNPILETLSQRVDSLTQLSESECILRSYALSAKADNRRKECSVVTLPLFKEVIIYDDVKPFSDEPPSYNMIAVTKEWSIAEKILMPLVGIEPGPPG